MKALLQLVRAAMCIGVVAGLARAVAACAADGAARARSCGRYPRRRPRRSDARCCDRRGRWRRGRGHSRARLQRRRLVLLGAAPPRPRSMPARRRPIRTASRSRSNPSGWRPITTPGRLAPQVRSSTGTALRGRSTSSRPSVSTPSGERARPISGSPVTRGCSCTLRTRRIAELRAGLSRHRAEHHARLGHVRGGRVGSSRVTSITGPRPRTPALPLRRSTFRALSARRPRPSASPRSGEARRRRGSAVSRPRFARLRAARRRRSSSSPSARSTARAPRRGRRWRCPSPRRRRSPPGSPRMTASRS